MKKETEPQEKAGTLFLRPGKIKRFGKPDKCILASPAKTKCGAPPKGK